MGPVGRTVRVLVTSTVGVSVLAGCTGVELPDVGASPSAAGGSSAGATQDAGPGVGDVLAAAAATPEVLAATGLEVTDPVTRAQPVAPPPDPCSSVDETVLAGVPGWETAADDLVGSTAGEASLRTRIWRFAGPDDARTAFAAIGSRVGACTSTAPGEGWTETFSSDRGRGASEVGYGWDVVVPGRATSVRYAAFLKERSVVLVSLEWRAGTAAEAAAVVPEPGVWGAAAALERSVGPAERSLNAALAEQQDG